MPNRSIRNGSGILPASLVLALCASLLPLRTAAQGWQRVVNLADSPGTAIGGGSGNTLYAGLKSGHVFRSDDNGLAWSAVTNGLVDKSGRMLLPKAFVVTPTGRVLRGGDNASWDNKIGSPVFRSDDRGTKWTEVPLPFASPTRNPGGIGISDMVVHKGAVYFSDLLSEGVWKSSDDGATWTAVGAQLPSPPFIGFAKTYYALASAGDALLTVQASKGVFRSIDGGTTWTQAVDGIPGVVDSPLVGGRTWNASDVAGAPDGTAFAVSDGRLYRSRDGGATWAETGLGILQSPNPFVPSIIGPSARKVEILGDRVFVSSSDGNPRFWEGTALGDSWTELPRVADNTVNADILSQSFAAHGGALYFAGNKGVHRLDLASAVRTSLLPVVTTTPAGPFGVNLGGTLRVAATARGTAPFTYDWRLNDAPIAGQTAAALDFTAMSVNQAGTLSLIVRNAAGSVTNLLGALAVAPVAPGAVDYGFGLVNSTNSLLDIIPLPVSVNTFAFGPDGSVFFGGALYSSKEGYTGIRKVFADGTVDRSFVTSGSAPGASAGAVTAFLPLNDGSVLVGASGTGNDERYYRRMLPTGGLDGSWPWPPEIAGGPRKLSRLPDGRILTAGGSVGGIRRLNADGTLDPTFQGPASIGRFQANYISDFALMPSGHVLVVGNFNDVDGVARAGIARLLPNGKLDRSWVPAQPPLNSTISVLAVLPDGKILIGGTFPTVGGQPHRNLARLNADGSLDATLGDLIPNSNPAAIVNAFAIQPDGKAWIGGAFAGISGRTNLFRLNIGGTVDTSFPDIAINGAISSLRLTPDGRLWIGGAATRIGGFLAGTPARTFTDIDGPTLGHAGLDQTPDIGTSVMLHGTVTGPFTGLQWRFKGAPIQGATALGLLLSNVASADSGAYDLVVTSARGSYTSAPVSVRVRGPVVLDLPPTPLVGVVSNSVTFAVTAFGKLPLAYQWSRDGAVIANANSRTLTLTNLQFSAAADYSVKVTGSDGSTATSAPAFLAVIPPPGAKDPAFRLGLFRPPNGGTAFLNDLKLLPDGRALVGGTFATVTNGPVTMLARLLPDGSVDPAFSFDPAGLSSFEAVDVQSDGRIIILVRSSAGGGPFLVRRLNADGSPDPTFPEPGLPTASAITVAPGDSLIVTHSSGLARLSPDGAPDAGFAARAKFDSTPVSVSIDPAGRIYAGGFFNTVGGQPRARLARLLADGSLDATFAPTNALNAVVTALADGVFGLTANGFTRFDNAGRADPDYAWSSGFAVMDLIGAGGLVGVLGTTFGDGVILNADGTDASPVSRMTVPNSFAGYRKLRIAPDGSIWLMLGSNSSFTEPVSLLFKLNGTVTPLALVTQPGSQTVLAGTTVTLTAAATGTTKVTYQWRRNGVDLAGETGPTLTVADFSAALAGDYTVVASNRSGSVVSRVATLTLLTPPVIVTEPVSVVVSPQKEARFDVVADGVQLRYQWQAGGTNVPGATNAALTLKLATAIDAGTYRVRVTNPAGEVVSRAARLRVRPTMGGGGGGPVAGLAARLRFENNLTEEVAGLLPQAFGAPTYVAGTEGGSAIKLRGGSDWLRLSDPNAGAGGRLTDEKFTVSFWIKPETAGTINVYSLIMLTPNGANFTGREHLLYLGGNDKLTDGNWINLYTRSFNSVVSTDDRAYVPNLVGKWTHLAVVYRGTTPANPDNFSVYVNGASLPLKGGPAIGGAVSLVNAIGRYAPSAFFQIDDFRVYNRALDAGEAASLMAPPVVDPPPVITGQPAGGTASAGGAFTFNVGATGAGLFYEWYRGETLLPEADGPALALSGLTAADAGAYRVVISNSGGSVDSAVAKLTVAIAADPFTTWAAAAGLTSAAADPSADPDHDGAVNLAEFAYGTSPVKAGDSPVFSVAEVLVGNTPYPTVTWTRRKDLGQVRIELSVASSADFTDDLGSTTVSVTSLADGLERVVTRSDAAGPAQAAQFFRFTVRR